MEGLIKNYFQRGLQHKEIVACLLLNDGINISLRQLRRILSKLRLFRRKQYSDMDPLLQFLGTEIARHGQLHGYRWMHLKCIQNGFTVTQNVVRTLLHILDPDGVEIRKRRRLRRRKYYNKGPNYLWHMDCYDKLKPFGICITGCIDGFSRYIIWLSTGPNTNDPAIIAHHFLQAVGSIGGCPQSLRADLGTENGVSKLIQESFKDNGIEIQSSLPSFLYGTSTANQRIEAWWSTLRKHHSQFWLNIFHALKENGSFSGTFLDKSLVQFCFMSLIQEELDIVVREWNMHKISRSRNSISPCGRPFLMYRTPQLYDTMDYVHAVSNREISEWTPYVSTPAQNSNSDAHELATIIMQEKNWSLPQEPSEAVDLYLKLRAEFENIL